MTRSNAKWWIFGAAVALILVIAGAFYLYHKMRKDPVTARQVNAPIPVKVLTVKKKELTYTVGAAGSAKEFSTVKLISKIRASVKSVKVDVGVIVKARQSLLEYDGRVLLSELASAETRLGKATVTLDNSRLNLQRIKELFEKKLVAKVELERAEQELAAAKAELDEATYNLTKTKNDITYLNMTSPIPGIVLERTVNPGESPALEAPLFTIGLIDTIFMAAKVPEQYVGDIAVGQSAEVVFDAYPSATYTGKVYKIDSSVNTETRVFLAYIALPNKDMKLRPGQTGFSRISFKKTALAVPSITVINPTGQRATVFVVDGSDTAYLRDIRTGVVTEDYTEVLSGLNEGDRIVAVGMKGLQNKDKVRIWEEVF
jgi:RND family efflux transporter MFP subunit